MTATVSPHDLQLLLNAEHPNPFGFLGLQEANGQLLVRTFRPDAKSLTIVDRNDQKRRFPGEKITEEGFFEARLAEAESRFDYLLEVERWTGERFQIADPYSFGTLLGELDMHLFCEGNHYEIYQKLGAHLSQINDHNGVIFSVWAPNAQRVSVVGDFNGWDGRVDPMRKRAESGVWEIFIPEVSEGAHYKFEVRNSAGQVVLKSDPFAFYGQHGLHTALLVFDLNRFTWHDAAWIEYRNSKQWHKEPISIYEVHLGSWARVPEENNRYLSYRELGDRLIPYVKDCGFTHIELMPVAEHPFDGSWGYQVTGYYAPTSRFGNPDEFRDFVNRCHQNNIGVILDWVPGHFPRDAHGLAQFDGTALYEHADPRQGEHQDWGTLIFNYGRNEVRNFLLSNALFWLEEYHVDGLRVDAVASMLYLDYSRTDGQWIANRFGGRENLEAIAFLRRMNELIFGEASGATSAAEESTAWPMVSRPVYVGGLGFGFKWNMGWMHDTLQYMSLDPIHRKYHHNDLTFGLLYAFHENFILPLSHDESVHGKGSLIGKMAGDRWQRFANLRAYFAYMWTHPGKKLLFMGGEFAQEREWNHDIGLDWQLLGDPFNEGVRRLVRDLNFLYRDTPALHQLDCDPDGFQWVDVANATESIVSYLRRSRNPNDLCVVVCNFTPVPRENYRIGVPRPGRYRERLNTDATEYGGSGVGNAGEVHAEPHPMHGHHHSISLRLPPLGALILTVD